MKHKLKKSLIYTYFIGILFFVILFLNKNFHLIKNQIPSVSISYLLHSIIFIFISLTIAGLIWSNIIKKIQIVKFKLPIIIWLKIFILGYMGRYIPGKIPLVLGRILFLEKYSYNKKAIVISSLYENIFILINVTFMTSIILLFIQFNLNLNLNFIILIIIISASLSSIFIFSPLFYKLFNIILQLFKKDIIEPDFMLKKKEIFKFILSYSGTFIMNGIAFYFFILSIFPEFADLNNFIFSSSIINISSISGMLAIIFPAGLGVKEGLMIFLLKYLITIEMAIFISIAYRIFQTIVELFYFFIILIWSKLISEKKFLFSTKSIAGS